LPELPCWLTPELPCCLAPVLEPDTELLYQDLPVLFLLIEASHQTAILLGSPDDYCRRG
jgi:hypothetical protein